MAFNKTYIPSYLRTIQGRLFFVVILVSLGFGVNIAFNVYESNVQAKQLQLIKEQHFPNLLNLQKALFSLKQMRVNLEEAILTSESAALERAELHKSETLLAIDGIVVLDSARNKKIDQLRQDLSGMYFLAEGLAKEFLNGASIHDEKLVAKGQEAAVLYENLERAIDDTRKEEAALFTDNVESASYRASSAVKLGAVTGLATVILLLLISRFFVKQVLNRIDFMVKQLQAVAEEKSDLSVRIPLGNTDEMSELARWFNVFIEKMEAITRQSEEEMKKLAYTDSLTAIHNRRYFNIHFQEVINLAAEEGVISPVIFFIDLDDFKKVNDTFGHELGDNLLCEVSEVLTSIARNAGRSKLGDLQVEGVAARMGGDEFMLLVPHLNDRNESREIAKSICREIQAIANVLGGSHGVGVSVGVAHYPEDGFTAEELIVNADTAMYGAKQKGKNNYEFYNEASAKLIRTHSDIEKALASAKDNNEFSLLIQPKYNLHNEQVVGGEMLIRWTNPDLGQVFPDEFISIAEKSNLIYQIDDWVMDQAATYLSDRLKKGKYLLPISINISSKQAVNPNLVAKIDDLLGRHNFPPGLLELEITETAAVTDLEGLSKNILEIRKRGIKVAIDDFGAGYSSLSLMKNCDIDTLKIDKQFIFSLGNRRVDLIVEGVIALSQKLKLNVIAEGVENSVIANSLIDMGCSEAQGYHFSKPVAIDDYDVMIELHSKEGMTGACNF